MNRRQTMLKDREKDQLNTITWNLPIREYPTIMNLTTVVLIMITIIRTKGKMLGRLKWIIGNKIRIACMKHLILKEPILG